jgi:hypothetical protein
MPMVECKRLHFLFTSAPKIHPGLLLAALALLTCWLVASFREGGSPAKPESDHADHYLGTWEITEPGARVRDGISYLMIAREPADGRGYVVSSERTKEVFRLRDGRLIHDTVTILYDDARDRISHSGLGELARKPK